MSLKVSSKERQASLKEDVSILNDTLPDFRKMAKEVIQSEAQTNIENPDRNIQDYKDSLNLLFAAEMERIETTFREKSKPNPKISEELITAASYYLVETTRHSNDPELLAAALRFFTLSKEVFYSSIGKDLEAYRRRQKIGIFITALCFFTPKNIISPSQKIVAEWMGEKERYIRDCFENVEWRDFWLNKLKSDKDYRANFIRTYEADIADIFILFADKEFPVQHANVLNAFNQLKTEFFQTFSGRQLKRPIFGIAPDWTDSEVRITKMRSLQNENA